MPGRTMTPGVFGKSAEHGDFLEAGVSAAAAAALHGWISAGLAGLDEADELDEARVLGFLSGPGVVGNDWCFGALAASHDRANRPFLWAALCEQADQPEARWAVAVADALAGAAATARREPLDRALAHLAQAVRDLGEHLDHVDAEHSAELLDMARGGRIAAWSDETCAVGRLSAPFFREMFAVEAASAGRDVS